MTVREALNSQPSLTMLELMDLTKLAPDRIRTEITKLKAAGAVTEITYFEKTKSFSALRSQRSQSIPR